MSMEENLRKYIDELIQEVEQELDEATTTAGVDGYQTPFAFGGGRDKDKKKQKKNIDVTGYTKVKDIDESVNEAMVSPKNGHEFFQLTKDTPIKYITKSYTTLNAAGVLWKNDTDYIDGKKGAYLIDYFGAAFYVDLKKKFASKIYPIKDQPKLSWKSNFIDVDKAPEMSDWKKFLKESVNESINEGFLDIFKNEFKIALNFIKKTFGGSGVKISVKNLVPDIKETARYIEVLGPNGNSIRIEVSAYQADWSKRVPASSALFPNYTDDEYAGSWSVKAYKKDSRGEMDTTKISSKQNQQQRVGIKSKQQAKKWVLGELTKYISSHKDILNKFITESVSESVNESDFKGQLAGDSVDSLIKSIGSRFVEKEIKNTTRDGKTYIKLKDEKFGSGVVKILKSRFGIDAKIDYFGGKGKIAATPAVSFKQDQIISEAKVKRPVNRWLELKNDDTMHPHKKMAHGLKELKYQLAETEKFFKWYNKIKNINELESSNYWKRTQSHIYKIKERLVNIARTIQEIEK